MEVGLAEKPLSLAAVDVGSIKPITAILKDLEMHVVAACQ